MHCWALEVDALRDDILRISLSTLDWTRQRSPGCTNPSAAVKERRDHSRRSARPGKVQGHEIEQSSGLPRRQLPQFEESSTGVTTVVLPAIQKGLPGGLVRKDPEPRDDERPVLSAQRPGVEPAPPPS
jgi:hypothetical protein